MPQWIGTRRHALRCARFTVIHVKVGRQWICRLLLPFIFLLGWMGICPVDEAGLTEADSCTNIPVPWEAEPYLSPLRRPYLSEPSLSSCVQCVESACSTVFIWFLGGQQGLRRVPWKNTHALLLPLALKSMKIKPLYTAIKYKVAKKSFIVNFFVSL